MSFGGNTSNGAGHATPPTGEAQGRNGHNARPIRPSTVGPLTAGASTSAATTAGVSPAGFSSAAPVRPQARTGFLPPTASFAGVVPTAAASGVAAEFAAMGHREPPPDMSRLGSSAGPAQPLQGQMHGNGQGNGQAAGPGRAGTTVAAAMLPPVSSRAPLGARGNAGATASPVLLVGKAIDSEAALLAGWPGVRVEHAEDWFDALARLQRRAYAVVVAPVADIRFRAEPALARLRSSAGAAKLILLAEPSQELMVRRLFAEGAPCDDYLIAPITPAEFVRVAGSALSRGPDPVAAEAVAPAHLQPPAAMTPTRPPEPVPTAPPARPLPTDVGDRPPGGNLGGSVGGNLGLASDVTAPFALAGVAVADVMLEALVREPSDAAQYAVRALNARLPGTLRFELLETADRDLPIPPRMIALTRLLPRVGFDGVGASSAPPAPENRTASVLAASRVLMLQADRSLDETCCRELLGQVAPQIARVLELQDRHSRLQKIAITDELTGLYNARYFHHKLDRILAVSRETRTPVTLLMFDIDNFKKYNDVYGHGVGDEILRQTGRMIRRCVRDHDLVARLGGDEFAVLFWEKDGPRAPIPGKSPQTAGGSFGDTSGVGTSGQGGQGGGHAGRPPQSPLVVFQRFKRLLAGHDFEALGPHGKGTLTISGGLAVYPYDAHTAESLIEAADRALMFGAKKSGKNTVHLVGGDDDSANTGV